MYFPARVQCFDNSLPSADSPWIRVRRFHWYYQVAVTSRFPFRFLRFLLVGDTLCRAISVSRRSHAFIELLWSPGLFRDFTGRGGTSQVSARPQLSVRACSKTPVGSPFQTLRKGDMAPQDSKTGSSDERIGISGLNSRAFGLAVYAS